MPGAGEVRHPLPRTSLGVDWRLPPEMFSAVPTAQVEASGQQHLSCSGLLLCSASLTNLGQVGPRRSVGRSEDMEGPPSPRLRLVIWRPGSQRPDERQAGRWGDHSSL